MFIAKARAKELGTNCWLAQRFAGGRCQRWDACNYPEKKTCRARGAEIDALKTHKIEHDNLAQAFQERIKELERGEG